MRLVPILLTLFAASCGAQPALAQTVHSPTDLDANRDGKVELTRPRGPFKAGDVLVRCADLPTFTYAKACPSPEPWVARSPRREFTGRQLWHNSYPAAPISGQVIEGVRATCRGTCVWAGRASTSTIVRDAELTRDGPAGPDDIDAGIKVGGSKGGVPTAGVLIERVYAHGWRQVAHKGYANGDGVVVNRAVRDVTIRDSLLADNADAGLDTKADLTTVENVMLSDNGHYGGRFWGRATVDRVTCLGNAWGCLELEAGGDATVRGLTVIGPERVVTTKEGATVTFLDCPDLSRWTGTVLVKGKGRVTFPPGCKLSR